MDNIDFEYIQETLKYNKWWRWFDLRGLRLKLIEPISAEYYPKYNDDRYFVTIINYLSEIHSKNSSILSDWVTFKCSVNTVNPSYSINLALLDFDYFNQLTKKCIKQNKN